MNPCVYVNTLNQRHQVGYERSFVQLYGYEPPHFLSRVLSIEVRALCILDR